MRLIDADELIKTYEKETGYKWNEKCILECPKCFIDNAPTIIKAEYIEQYIEGLIDGRNRLQGEWIWSDNRWGLGDWLCNKCEHYAHDKSNFCPNCGAEMVGGES